MKDNGGPAFPVNLPGWDATALGMTLRDYMAIHASEEDIKAQIGAIQLVDIVMKNQCGTKSVVQDRPLNARQIARYMHADAMLKERT